MILTFSTLKLTHTKTHRHTHTQCLPLEFLAGSLSAWIRAVLRHDTDEYWQFYTWFQAAAFTWNAQEVGLEHNDCTQRGPVTYMNHTLRYGKAENNTERMFTKNNSPSNVLLLQLQYMHRPAVVLVQKAPTVGKWKHTLVCLHLTLQNIWIHSFRDKSSTVCFQVFKYIHWLFSPCESASQTG